MVLEYQSLRGYYSPSLLPFRYYQPCELLYCSISQNHSLSSCFHRDSVSHTMSSSDDDSSYQREQSLPVRKSKNINGKGYQHDMVDHFFMHLSKNLRTSIVTPPLIRYNYRSWLRDMKNALR